MLFYFLLLMLPLRFLGYNPLSANEDCRLVDIIDEASNFDVIALAGTCQRFQDGVQSVSRQGFSVYSCGYSRSPLTNKSCGVAIALGKRFRSGRV